MRITQLDLPARFRRNGKDETIYTARPTLGRAETHAAMSWGNDPLRPRYIYDVSYVELSDPERWIRV